MNFKRILTHTKNGWLIILKKEMLFLPSCWMTARGDILAYGLELSDMKYILADDPFVNLGLVKAEINLIDFWLCSSHFYSEWAGNAKAL